MGTKLHVRLGKMSSPTFPTTIGIPQGDSLSLVLFTVYLEAALRQLRKEAAPRPHADLHLPLELIYADDAHYISTSRRWLSQLETTARSTLVQWSLNMNHDKTEYTEITRLNDRNKEEWRSTRKLGSLIGDDEDVLRRKQLVTAPPRLESLLCRIGTAAFKTIYMLSSLRYPATTVEGCKRSSSPQAQV